MVLMYGIVWYCALLDECSTQKEKEGYGGVHHK
jgi:hypothetical protein